MPRWVKDMSTGLPSYTPSPRGADPMTWDPAKLIDEILRRFRRHLIETEYMVYKLMEDFMGELWTTPSYESEVSMLASGATEPLASIQDMGDHILIAVMIPGARRESVDIRIHKDKVIVTASVDYRMVNRALGGHLSRTVRVEKYHGEYRLPDPVDPSSATYELRGDMIVIKVRKALA